MPEITPQLTDAHRELLRGVARRSIEHGLASGAPLSVNPADYPQPLCAEGACFVTLHLGSEFHGCIGTLTARSPLVVSVAQNAYFAAYDDPRSTALNAAKLALLAIKISVVAPAEPLDVASEAELVRVLQPFVHGLTLEDLGLRGTLLPSVWESLGDPLEFVRHVKRKAGLPADYWSKTLKAWRYTTEEF